MRAALIASAVLAFSSASARAEDMILTNQQGIMCRDEKSLADFTASDGTLKRTVMADPLSAFANRYRTACRDAGTPVHVVTKRKNTSIVTFEGAIWYVPNIDYFTPTADCIKETAHVTMTGKVETGFKQTDEVNPKIGYRYPRLALDKPVCFLGNQSEQAGRYVSLTANSEAQAAALMKMVGQHVTVTGEVDSPDNGNQPPDPMMMFNPAVKLGP